jgi:hypothetical protein
MSDAPTFAEDLERAERVAEVVRDELLEVPGVVLVGAGVERRRGRPTGRAAIVVSVRIKLSRRALKTEGRAALPDVIEDVPVDVVVYGQSPETAAIRREFAAAIKAKDRAADAWLAAPNVTAIGVGYKIVGGDATEVVAIHVFVERKLSADEVALGGLRLVPETINGIPTDVIEGGPFTSTVLPSGSRGDRRDPLIGGLSLGHATAPFHYGTLAAIAFDNSNAAVAISNEHVLDGEIGETVQQPSPIGLDDSFRFDLQLDVCNPLHFFRIDTPSTTVGSILAGAAIAAATAAALSDDIDPTREGQEATPVASGTITTEEYTKVRIDYPAFPMPGRPFDLGVDLNYERRTTSGAQSHAVRHERRNPHVLAFHRLFTDRLHYPSGDVVRLFGVVVPEDHGRASCDDFHCVALLRPVGLDQSWSIVLRPWSEARPIGRGGSVGPRLANLPAAVEIAAPDRQAVIALLLERGMTPEDVKRVEQAKHDPCLYYGEFTSADVPTGPWRHWMFVQTQNTVAPGTDPLAAAKIIGGLPLSDQFRSTVDVACGPIIFEDDGSFDIELT